MYGVVSILMLALVPISFADIPKIINYQGRVTDNSGTPVPDGIYDMVFSIWPSESGGGFEPLWQSGTHNVEVTDGIFNTLLGTVGVTPLDLEFAQDLWLEVTIEGETQTPRQRFGSVGYAYMASGLVAGTEVSGSVETGTNAAIKGTNTATVPLTYGLYGETSSPWGVGCYGSAPTTTGASSYGVYGYTASGGGAGVKGYSHASTGQTCGGEFYTWSTLGRAVYADADAPAGYTYGVYALNASTDGKAVYGSATAVSGDTYGLYGKSASPDGRGVHGEATATTGNCSGVFGSSTSTDLARGVCGVALATTGYTYGVYGWSLSEEGYGVAGVAQSTSGVTFGVYGEDFSPSGFGVFYSGGLGGTGAKNCIVRTSEGPTLLYCQESPECWFEDFGEDQLVSGRCRVELDPLFLETVTIDETNPMHVFVQLHDPNCEGVAVDRGRTGFDVVELKNGASDVSFSYRVVAKRRGFEEKRLDYCKAAESDPYLYPEFRDKRLRELEGEMRRSEEERRRMEERQEQGVERMAGAIPPPPDSASLEE
jgi:hypothetical protein